MQLQRYLQKEQDKGIYFGDHFRADTWHYKWYMSENSIGVEVNSSEKAEHFIDEFLTKEDKLIIKPSMSRPKIVRDCDLIGIMSGRGAGIREVGDLIELIQGQNITHVYFSSIYKNGSNPTILTFSSRGPPNEFYNTCRIMPVIVKS